MKAINPAQSAPVNWAPMEYLLLVLLSVMWGSSYLFIAVALEEIPPITLIAIRVSVSALFLILVMRWKGESLPTDPTIWRGLFILAIFNSIGAWTVLAWGQKYVDSSLASILNSTPPIFVVLFSVLIGRKAGGLRAGLGVLSGLAGVILIVGYESLSGIGLSVAGQLACVLGAAFYGAAAIYSERFERLTPLQISACTMIWATSVIGPMAYLVEGTEWTLPSMLPLSAALALALFSTAFALLIYFRLVRTLGPLGAASQSYLRVGVGVVLGVFLLGDELTTLGALGFVLCVFGVLMINWPVRKGADQP